MKFPSRALLPRFSYRCTQPLPRRFRPNFRSTTRTKTIHPRGAALVWLSGQGRRNTRNHKTLLTPPLILLQGEVGDKCVGRQQGSVSRNECTMMYMTERPLARSRHTCLDTTSHICLQFSAMSPFIIKLPPTA